MNQDDDMKWLFMSMAQLTRLSAKKNRTKAEEEEYQRLVWAFSDHEEQEEEKK